MTGLFEPALTAAVARRVAGAAPPDGSYLFDRLQRDLEDAVGRAEELVGEVSGIPAPPPVRWAIVDRARWAEVNVASMATLLRPVSERAGKRFEGVPFPLRAAQRGIVSAELGVLLGYVARRVLGQYDVLVAEPPDRPEPATRSRRAGGRKTRAAPSLYFVGQNMVEAERRFGFVPEDFALWVALHEVTHRFQFAGVPWLREHFFSLVTRYIESMELDAPSLARRLARAAARLATKTTPVEERNPVYLLASEEQRAILDEIQATMAAVEGHGNFVMDQVGARVIPSFKRMRDTFERRREDTGAVQRAVNYAIGLELKMRQYELGQAFCNAVYRVEGLGALERLWVAPGGLPTLAELKEPERWLQRVA